MAAIEYVISTAVLGMDTLRECAFCIADKGPEKEDALSTIQTWTMLAQKNQELNLLRRLQKKDWKAQRYLLIHRVLMHQAMMRQMQLVQGVHLVVG